MVNTNIIYLLKFGLLDIRLMNLKYSPIFTIEKF